MSSPYAKYPCPALWKMSEEENRFYFLLRSTDVMNIKKLDIGTPPHWECCFRMIENIGRYVII